MNSRKERGLTLNPSPESNFESPFLGEDLLAGESQVGREARFTARDSDSPFCKVAVLGDRENQFSGDTGPPEWTGETAVALYSRNRAEPSGEGKQGDFAGEDLFGDEFEQLEEEGLAFDGAPEEEDGLTFEGAPEVSPAIAEALRSTDWLGALRLAIGAGWRDDGKLTNLVFFGRHPELGGRALDTKHSKFAEHSREWVAIRDVDVRKAIEEFAQNSALVVSGKEAAEYDRHFRSQGGQRFKLLIEQAARDADLNPGMLAATLLAETGSRNRYLTSSKVKSYHIGVDDFYDRRAALAARVPAYSRIRWDRHQVPEVHYNDAKKPRLVRTIWFDSGPAALLASAVYLKYGEARLQEESAKLGGDFDKLPLATRWALIRMAFNAGVGGAQKRLVRALSGEDILVRKDVKVKAYQTDRNATVRTAQAIHLSDWIFGTPVKLAFVQSEREGVPADDEFAESELPAAIGESHADFWPGDGEPAFFERLEDVDAELDLTHGLEEAQLESEDAAGGHDHDEWQESLQGAEAVEDPASSELPRQAPAVKTTSDHDKIIVTAADGTRYHVLRKVRARVLRRGEKPSVGFFWDDERVFGRLTWCEGTQGTIEVGANIPGAARRLLDTVIGQINRRARPEEVARTLESAQVQTFVELAITKHKSWRFLGNFKLDLNPAGVVSKSAALSFNKGPFKVSVEYKDDGTGKQVLLTLDVPLDNRTVSGRNCEQRELVIWWDAECLRERTSKDIIPVPGYRTYQKTLYLYFEKASSLLRRDPKATAESAEVLYEILNSDPQLGTALLNKRTLQKLDYHVGQGYWLDVVKGYTSPEGRRGSLGPNDRGAAEKWEGNKQLSERRAGKVVKLLRARYGGLSLRMRDLPPRMRFPEGKTMPSGVGLSEFPRLDLALGVELEGSALDRVMVHGSLKGRDFKFECSEKGADKGPFVDQCPGEKAGLTERDRRFVTDSRDDRQRAERLFENLRRVEIHLLKREKLSGIAVSSVSLVHDHDCPKTVMDAAFRHWGTRVMFTRPDPPVAR